MEPVAPFLAAPQHRPRPLPLFMEMLRQETAANPARMAQALAGVRAYQEAPRADRLAPAPAVKTIGRVTLRAFGGSGPPAVFVPSLINPPDVLDVSSENSVLRWLAGQGVRPYLVDWGMPFDVERDLSIGGHVETLLLPLLADFGPDLRIAGYCLGGTMTLALAMLRPAAGYALLAAPWVFRGFTDASRMMMTELWGHSHLIADRLGYLPMEVLQIAFWRLDPARTIDKFERFAHLDPGSTKAAEFVALEDWANGGAPLTYGAAREMIEDLFLRDLAGRGTWQIAGRTVDPATIAAPIFNVVSRTDRIVPAASAAPVGTRLDLDLGHVGMLVGSRAKAVLLERLAAWLREPR